MATQQVRVEERVVNTLKDLVKVRGLSESLGQLVLALVKKETSKYITVSNGLVATGDTLLLANDDRTISDIKAILISTSTSPLGVVEYTFNNGTILPQSLMWWSQRVN